MANQSINIDKCSEAIEEVKLALRTQQAQHSLSDIELVFVAQEILSFSEHLRDANVYAIGLHNAFKGMK